MKIKNILKERLFSKNGNSFLFMPYLITFGITMMYMAMEMGTAYVRNIELQTITDASARAGVYAGMQGSGSQYFVTDLNTSDEHVTVDLDDSVAYTLAARIFNKNVQHMSCITNDASKAKPGSLVITHIVYSNYKNQGISSSLRNEILSQELPVWDVQAKKYVNVPISKFREADGSLSGARVMATGNFYVAIEGKYHTLIANNVVGVNTIDLQGFASALATAKVK